MHIRGKYRRTVHLWAAVALGGVSLTSCRKAAAPERISTGSAVAFDASRELPTAGLGRYLPDRAGSFVAGPLLLESGFVRRSYTRGVTTVGVTIADAGGAAVSYDDWLKMSAGYVQASLDTPPGSAAGFYTCTGPRDTGQCDLHIHCRAGYHLEVMGGGGASRADLDEVMRSVPLRALVTRGDDEYRR
jgi:hypothetical protein